MRTLPKCHMHTVCNCVCSDHAIHLAMLLQYGPQKSCFLPYWAFWYVCRTENGRKQAFMCEPGCSGLLCWMLLCSLPEEVGTGALDGAVRTPLLCWALVSLRIHRLKAGHWTQPTFWTFSEQIISWDDKKYNFGQKGHWSPWNLPHQAVSSQVGAVLKNPQNSRLR